MAIAKGHKAVQFCLNGPQEKVLAAKDVVGTASRSVGAQNLCTEQQRLDGWERYIRVDSVPSRSVARLVRTVEREVSGGRVGIAVVVTYPTTADLHKLVKGGSGLLAQRRI